MPQVKDKTMKIFIINLVLLLLFSTVLFAQGTTQYVYDANGRLTQVISPSGQVSVYEYDFAGNLTRIRNEQNPVLLISNFSPANGGIGSSVIIRGVGFNIIPAQNQVKFNGVSAIVLSSNLTELTVTVPFGATTGKVQVTNTLGTAISAANFIVASIPIITSFSPVLGKINDSVTINGSGFSDVVEEDTVKFNQANATVSDATLNLITTSVSSNAVSGRISVGTDFGEGVSSQDFYVVPNNFDVADVSQTARLTYTQTYPVDIPTPKKLSLFVFEGTAAGKININLQNISSGIKLTIKSPSNSQVWQFTTYSNTFPKHIELPETGTYSLSVEALTTDPTAADLTLYQTPADIIDTILTDGTPKSAGINTIGQRVKLNFTVAQTTLVLRFQDVTIQNYLIRVYKEDGQFITQADASPTNLLYLSGNYYILFEPQSANVGSATFSLQPIPNIVETIETNGTPVTLHFTVIGQNGELNFSATAGQNYSLRISDVTAADAHFSVVSPSNQTIYSDNIGFGYTGATASFSTAEPGTYKIIYDPLDFPGYHVLGDATFRLTLLNDVVGNLVINDPPTSFTSTLAGQSFRISVAGNEGQRFYLKTVAADFYYLNLTVKKPDNTNLITNVRIDSDSLTDINNLPTTGNYTLLITPEFPNQFGSLQLQAIDNNVSILNNPLKSIHTYFINPAVIDIAGKKLKAEISNLALPTAAYRLTANAGEQFSFATPVIIPNSLKLNSLIGGTIKIYKPDGSLLTSSPIDNGICNITLPVAGEYTIEVSPEGGTQDFILKTLCGGPSS
jgi:large repetitive protein